ncbi:MAG: ABC transporter permease [Acetanaerobacterium sp.]
MRISDVISMCLRNLLRRGVRTLLTVTGVVIGTCAIIVTISLGVGMDTAQTEMLESMMDLTVIEVYNYGGMDPSSPQMVKLDDQTLEGISGVDHVTAVTPLFDLWSGRIKLYSGKYEYQGGMTGVYLDQLENFGYEIKDGVFPTPEDGEQAILFGEQAAYSFFNPKKPSDYVYPEPDESGNIPDPFVNPLEDRFIMTVTRDDQSGGKAYYGGGRAVMISAQADTDDGEEEDDSAPTKKYEYRMKNTGVLVGNYRDYSTMSSVFVDIEFAKELNALYNKLNDIHTNDSDDDSYQYAKVRVDDMNNVGEVAEQIESLGFETYSAEDYREPMRQQTMIIQLILGSLGGISLLVAALGIANTMIMSIYERTREIGVMKVLGCKLSNIRSLFLLEAGSIGLLGGVLGVGISYLASFILNKVLAGGMMGNLGFGMSDPSVKISIIPLWLVLLGLSFALLVGLFSGFYPANRAVKISALEANKHE